jgi:hypothetical protein
MLVDDVQIMIIRASSSLSDLRKNKDIEAILI